MKWVILIAAILVGLILLVVIIGLILPKAHRATHMARFKQRPEEIFALIAGPQDWRGVKRTELASDGGVRRWSEEAGWHAVTFEQTANEPPYRFGSKIVDKGLPYSGNWTWEITATDEGCTCRITEEGEVSNPIFRVVGRFVIGYTKTIDDYLNALGKKFSEPVKIEQ